MSTGIRLDTGDLGVYDGKTCDCGRGMPRIIGKISGTERELSGDIEKPKKIETDPREKPGGKSRIPIERAKMI